MCRQANSTAQPLHSKAASPAVRRSPSPGYFNRVFKRELGISPSQFRKAGS
ncbi:MAG TPA: AraC family transcriptional regulator [Candidatus Faeciplasma avium]|uniref:AraC family transcriptional regulator n=1 Tax=Candidatus Faeciplasma avium TaxID=2840798 RepID=A0A9D1NRA3_9FIRM|nr:AraC family transcriptional regulator [Candidatus Faeciplasma avium]